MAKRPASSLVQQQGEANPEHLKGKRKKKKKQLTSAAASPDPAPAPEACADHAKVARHQLREKVALRPPSDSLDDTLISRTGRSKGKTTVAQQTLPNTDLPQSQAQTARKKRRRPAAALTAVSAEEVERRQRQRQLQVTT